MCEKGNNLVQRCFHKTNSGQMVYLKKKKTWKERNNKMIDVNGFLKFE